MNIIFRIIKNTAFKKLGNHNLSKEIDNTRKDKSECSYKLKIYYFI